MPHRLREDTDDAADHVVDLGARRERCRSARYLERIDAVLADHRRALSRLFESGMIFSRHGTRAGQELLRAQQHLLQLADLVGKGGAALDTLVEEIETLLEKSSALARRHKALFQSR